MTDRYTNALQKRIDALTAEVNEQARLNGMGSEREAKLMAQVQSLSAENAELKRDLDAHRGALGYAIPGDHDGKCSDGTIPNNGIAEVLYAQLAELKHDIHAYRGALGYVVPGDHDGKLSDGTTPINGIAEALASHAHKKLSAELAALRAHL